MGFVVYDQIEFWTLNPEISSMKRVDLSEVDFPAITFCHQGNTRMAIADVLLKLASEKAPKVKQMKSLLLKNTVEYYMRMLPNVYSQSSVDIYNTYKFFGCLQYYTGPTVCKDCLCYYYDF